MDECCCVCLGEITETSIAPCGHKFCQPCILKTLGMAPPEWSGNCPLCRAHVSVYNLRDISGARLVTPDVGTIFGCVFVQHGGLGCASYHFDAEDDCYISYASAPAQWRLDDGSRPPAKKNWSDARFDPETSTFHGVIEWDPPFNGNRKWVYRIVFAEDFVGIIGGEVAMTVNDGSTNTMRFSPPWEDHWDSRLAYLRWTPPSTSIFGTAYVQGPLYSFFLEGIASYHFDAEDDCYISYANAPNEWRLDDGSAPPRKKPFTNTSYDHNSRIFRGDVLWNPCFGGSARWEYEITFAEDFSHICGGGMQPYGLDGTRKQVHRFGNPTEGRRRPGNLYYVQKPPVLTISDRLRPQLPPEPPEDLNQSEDHHPIAVEHESRSERARCAIS